MADTPTIAYLGLSGLGGNGQSEAALLRTGLVRVWDVAGSLERLVASVYETASSAISHMAADLEYALGMNTKVGGVCPILEGGSWSPMKVGMGTVGGGDAPRR